MNTFKKLDEFEVLSFDLDDTLYCNKKVLFKAELELFYWLNHNFKISKQYYLENISLIRKNFLENNMYRNDLTLLRLNCLIFLFEKLGFTIKKSKHEAHKALEIFLFYRNQILVESDIIKLLSSLSMKYILISITNGNLDIGQTVLNKFFQYNYKSGKDGRAKPKADMFELAISELNIKPSKILHIGDSYVDDVIGSVSCSMKSCWINLKHEKLNTNHVITPDFEIKNILELKKIL